MTKRTRKTLYQRLFDSRAAIVVKDIEAARAVYLDAERQRIEVKVTDEAGNHLTLEMTSQQAHRLIAHMTTAYQAIHPQLPGSGYGQHWGMQ